MSVWKYCLGGDLTLHRFEVALRTSFRKLEAGAGESGKQSSQEDVGFLVDRRYTDNNVLRLPRSQASRALITFAVAYSKVKGKARSLAAI